MIKHIQEIGVFKTHLYTTYQIAPPMDHQNQGLDAFIQSFSSIINHQVFKEVRGGQPVIAFELTANSTSCSYLYHFPQAQERILKERLESTYPGAGIQRVSPSYDWIDDNTLIAELVPVKAPFFPFGEGDLSKPLLHVMEALEGKEQALLQILIEPLHDGWQQEIEQAYLKYLHGDDRHTQMGGFLRNGGKYLDAKLSQMVSGSSETAHYRRSNHREIKEFKSKCRQMGFHVCVRVLCRASSYDRRNDVIEGMTGAIKGSNYENQWQLSPIWRKKAMQTAVRERKIGLFSSPALLGTTELKSLLHLPTKEVITTKLERMKPDEERVDERITQTIIPVGHAIEFGGSGMPVGFSVANPDTSSKARLWIAPPGSGKTTMVKIFMQGALNHGHGGSLFDIADGSLYYGAIEATPPEHRKKLVLVNFANEAYPHVFNFNALGRDADTIGLMFAEFFEIYYKTAANHRMNSFLKKASMTTFANPDSGFLELILLMRDEDFRRAFLPTIRTSNADLFLWWKSEFPKIAKSDSMMNEILQPILYRLDNLQYNPRLGPLFCGQGGRLAIGKWMNAGCWVLYNISNGVFLEVEQRMIMSFLNYAYWSATLEREAMLQKGLEPVIHHKMFDEPQTYMTATPIVQLSISKSRKYRVSDNFLIQNPYQVKRKDEALWNEIIGMNPHILVGGGLDNDSLKEMAGVLGIRADELKRLEELEYHWYFKTYVGKEALKPFVFDARMKIPTYGKDTKLEQHWQQRLAPLTKEEHKERISARNLRLSVDEYRQLLSSFEEADTEEEGVSLGENP